MSLSAATPTKGLSPQVAKDSLAYLRRAIERMKSLQATERVIASLERVVLNRVPEAFEVKPMILVINALNLVLREGDESKIQLAQDVVSQELAAALTPLVRRDEVILPSDLRRFCEADSSLLDLNALAALTSFYRSLPPTEACRSKYDFVITRLFSSAEPGRRQRQLRSSREQISKRLMDMCRAWGESPQRDSANAARIAVSLQQFDDFIAEIKTIHKLEVLVSHSFFQRVRDFKADVGNLLFSPEVTAASVEANVIIANRFWALLEIEGEALHEAPEELHLLADAFSDIYSNEPDEISRILSELQASNQHDEIAQGRVFRFIGLLRLATKAGEESSFSLSAKAEMFGSEVEELNFLSPANVAMLGGEVDTALEWPTDWPLATAPAAIAAIEEELQTLAEQPENQELLTTDAIDPVAEELQALTEQPENQELLAAYRKASAEVRKLDLHCFLSALPDGDHEDLQGADKSRRASLELIFNADQLVQVDLGAGCEPGDDLEARVDTLFDALGQRSEEMRELIKVTHEHDQNANYEVLLHVCNQLMAARLRLQSALVRRSACEIADAQKEETTAPLSAPLSPEAAPEIVQENSTENVQKSAVQNSRFKWLVVVAVLLIVAVIGLRFASSGSKVLLKDDTDVVRLAPDQLPHGELFAEVKLHRDLLLCVATEKWLTLAAQEQKEKLQELLDFGQERGAIRILLVDAKGTTVGSATKDELYVN